MRRGDLHEPVAAGLVGGPLARGHQRVVGTRERDPVDQHQLAGVARHVEALPEARACRTGRCAGPRRTAGPARAAAPRPGPGWSGAAAARGPPRPRPRPPGGWRTGRGCGRRRRPRGRRSRRAGRAPGRRARAAAGARRRTGCPAGRSRTASRRRCRATAAGRPPARLGSGDSASEWSTRSLGLRPSEVATERRSRRRAQRRAGQHHGLLGEAACRAAGPTPAAARRRAGRRPGPVALGEPRARRPRSSAAIRSLFLNSSCTAAAWPGCGRRRPRRRLDSLGNAEISARAASRTSASASDSGVGSVSRRPGGQSSKASRSASPASARSSASVPSTCRWARRAARSTSGTGAARRSPPGSPGRTARGPRRSPPTSYSGIIGTPSIASMASSEWLVTISCGLQRPSPGRARRSTRRRTGTWRRRGTRGG